MTRRLGQIVRLCASKIAGRPDGMADQIRSDAPMLIVLAAGKGTRFGKEPKCVQEVGGKPLARHSIDAFATLSAAPALCLVGYRADRVIESLGEDNLFVHSDDPAGGTALAAMEAFSVEQLELANPIVVVTMGDRIVPASIFQRLLETHRQGDEAELTMLTAVYDPPRHQGKGRIIRDPQDAIRQIVEQPDIDRMYPGPQRQQLDSLREGNCPLYAIRAATLKHYLGNITEDNAQSQFYFTDIVEAIDRDGGVIRSVTIDSSWAEYPVLCADVTRPADLPALQRVLQQYQSSEEHPPGGPLEPPAAAILAERSAGQSLSIAAQLEELAALSRSPEIGFDPSLPVGIGISGGRLRIAFMHPDMGRFFGPAWQMPIGAADESGREQIVVMVQACADNAIHLYPSKRVFREDVNAIPADMPCMYPPVEIVDGYAYESFGTAMTQRLLSTLGYVDDDEIAAMADRGADLPAADSWVSNAMRRPFALLGNVIASFRTVRQGERGHLVQSALGLEHFRGLKVVSTGEIPQGGFSSSSAFTVAAINAIDALFQFQFECDQKVELACQSEYGTGVRAGALDQATEQTGRHSVGALISSNPKENYCIIGTYDVPADRFRVHFPYTVDRDSAAWQWSGGVYASAGNKNGHLTAAEMRKMTGKASELAAILIGLPLEVDLFQEIEHDLVESGQLCSSSMRHVRDRLRQIPLRITQSELRGALEGRLDWYLQQQQRLDPDFTRRHAQRTFESLLEGWRDPDLRRTTAEGEIVQECGAPLRTMVGYLYAEVAHNCYLIHHPDQWIDCVTRSQRGDRCFDIDIDALPPKRELIRRQDWERDTSAADRMQLWLRRLNATPFDFNRGIGDEDLSDPQWCLTSVRGTNFFRGLALIDLAEAMLKRAFGHSAVAVRVNGAGQGDYFQVHVDSHQVELEEVKDFIRRTIYKRFDLNPKQDFVQPHPGGGAVGLRLAHHADLLKLTDRVRRQARQRDWQGHLRRPLRQS